MEPASVTIKKKRALRLAFSVVVGLRPSRWVLGYNGSYDSESVPRLLRTNFKIEDFSTLHLFYLFSQNLLLFPKFFVLLQII